MRRSIPVIRQMEDADCGAACLAMVLGHLGQATPPPLLEQERQEVDLEQHVAELVQQLPVVTRMRGVGQLVGLLDRVRDDRPLVLLAVPRAFPPE